MPSDRGRGPAPTPSVRHPKPRPGGRTARHTQRIHEATVDLLVEDGVAEITFQKVADRSGVSRATMYRRWPSPAHLVADAIRAQANSAITVPDLGSLVADLTEVLHQIAAFIVGPVGRAALGASVSVGPVDGVASSWTVRWAMVEPVMDRAITRGELDPGTDGEALFASVAGAMYFRVLVAGRRVDDDWIERVLASTILGFRHSRGAV